MSIDAKTVEHLMKKAGLTQTGLAELARVSVKTVSRILKSAANPNEDSVQKIAKALKVLPEELAAAPDDERRRHSELAAKEAGYSRLNIYLDGKTLLNFALVEKRYGLSTKALIKTAPLFATLLAEMSLADRRNRLSSYKAAFEAATAAAPSHLQLAFVAQTSSEIACEEEEASIKAADLSGDLIGEDGWNDNATDLFVAFLNRLREGISPDAIRELDGEASSLDYSIWEGELARITNNDDWAKFALEYRHARITDIPTSLSGDENATARVAWLVAQIPEAARRVREAWWAELESAAGEV